MALKDKKWKSAHTQGGSAVYGLGIVGALFYFLQNANGFGEIVMGILKSFVWPAFFVFKVFEFLRP